MSDFRGHEQGRPPLFEIVEAAGTVSGKASLVYAAGLRAVRTHRPDHIEQFFRHMDRLDDADQIWIALLWNQRRHGWSATHTPSSDPADEASPWVPVP